MAEARLARCEHHMSVRRGLASWRRRLPMRSGWLSICIRWRRNGAMQSISRCGVVISAGTAGAVFGRDRPLEFVGRAFAQQAGGPDVVKFKIGDIEVIQM